MKIVDPGDESRSFEGARRWLDVEADLYDVMRRGERRRRRHAKLVSFFAVLVVFGLATPITIGALYLFRGTQDAKNAQPAASNTAQTAASNRDAVRSLETYGGTIAWSDADGRTHLASAGAESVLPSSYKFQGVAISPVGPDGGVFTFKGIGEYKPVFWYPDGTEVGVDLSPALTFLWPAIWSPDGETLGIETCDADDSASCDLQLVRTTDGASTVLLQTHGQGFAWNADGSEIAYINPDRGLGVIDLASGNVTEALPFGTREDLLSPTWSPDGGHLAVVTEDKEGLKPLILTPQGDVVGEGTAAHSPPRMTWVGDDSLLFSQEMSTESSMSVIVGAMDGPGWSPTVVAKYPDQAQPQLFVSPGRQVALLQTIDTASFPETGFGASGIPSRWLLVDLASMNQEARWDIRRAKVLAWG
jgi:hypothetical protein